MNDEDEIVYSSDGSGKNLAKGKKKKKDFGEVDPTQVKLHIRLEKKKRGGKVVTVIDGISENPPYFKKLLKMLKNKCGTGGAQRPTHLEIQGDYREKISEILKEEGFTIK